MSCASSGIFACGKPGHRRPPSRENIMIRPQYRSALATACVFIALASLLGVVHAMLVDERIVPYAIVTLVSGIVAFVAQLNPASRAR